MGDYKLEELEELNSEIHSLYESLLEKLKYVEEERRVAEESLRMFQEQAKGTIEENKKLKRKVEVLLSDLDNEKNALKAMTKKPVKYREENKKLKDLVEEAFLEGCAEGFHHCGQQRDASAKADWENSYIKEELENL